MAKYVIEDTTLTGIADAIRGKEGSSAEIPASEMAGRIEAIETGSTPEITVSSAGLITATAGTKSATKQLSTQAAAAITPGTSDKTAVSSGVYTTGAITVKGDSNLKAENIKSGVSIFGVSGTLSASSILIDRVSTSGSATIYHSLSDVTGIVGAVSDKALKYSEGSIVVEMGYIIDAKSYYTENTDDYCYVSNLKINKTAKTIRCDHSKSEVVVIYDPSKSSICNA